MPHLPVSEPTQPRPTKKLEQVGVISKGPDDWQTFVDRLNHVLAEIQMRTAYRKHHCEWLDDPHDFICIIYYTQEYYTDVLANTTPEAQHEQLFGPTTRAVDL